jgi:hypothetical protein
MVGAVQGGWAVNDAGDGIATSTRYLATWTVVWDTHIPPEQCEAASAAGASAPAVENTAATMQARA